MNIEFPYLVIDVETVRPKQIDERIEQLVNNKIDKRLKDKDKIEENKKKHLSSLALDPYVGCILMIGMKRQSQNIIMVNKEMINNEIDQNFISGDTVIMYYDNEKHLLEEFNSMLNNYIANGGVIITFNGKEFDLPFVMIRSIINDTENIISSYFDLVHKYSHNMHVDLYNIFDKSLKDIAIAFNIEFSDISGKDIAELYENNRYEDIVNKNVEDLYQTEYIFNKSYKWFAHKIKTVL